MNALLQKKTQTPMLHLLPKIHKASKKGRHVISSFNCHTSRISEFVDHYLQPEVTKNTDKRQHRFYDFIKKIQAKDNVTDDSYLVLFALYILTYLIRK